VHVGEAEVATGVAESKLLVVEAEEVEDRGVEVMDRDLVRHRLVAVLVRLAVAEAALDAAAGETGREALFGVVAAVASLRMRGKETGVDSSRGQG